jgi:hypothetical protein
MPAAIVRSAATLGLERAMLVPLALALSLVACQEPEQTTGPSLSQAALPNSITLTYICGNSFRVRNTNPEAITVTWDVYQQGETGTLVLPPKPASAPYSETYFTTVKKGTVRLFLDGVLKQTKANGNKPACQLPVAGWPILGMQIPLPDTSKVVTSPNGDLVLFRTDIKLRFVPGTSDASKQELFTRYSMTVLGEEPTGGFFVRIPDPGPDWSALHQVLDLLNAEPTVRTAAPLLRGNLEVTPNARYPSDGAGFQRTDWLQGSASTWALRAIRAPLAWGCENGSYGGVLPRIGLLEGRHNGTNPDIIASSPQLRSADTLGVAITSRYGLIQSTSAKIAELSAHATWTSTLLSATGNNDLGTSGVMWRSRLYLYEAVDPAGFALPFSAAFYRIVSTVVSDAPRILSISVDQYLPQNALGSDKELWIAELAGQVESMLQRADSLTIVMAAGDSAFVGTRQAYDQVAQPGILLSALLRLKAQYPDRILIVSGTTEPGQFAASFPGTPDPKDGANYFTGLTDILAPAAEVSVQTTSGSIVQASGTSLSAPLVAGVAGQLLTMNPLLTPSDIARLLRDGAKQERVNPITGAIELPPSIPVTGSSDVVRQLDAYGSLSLLSATDASTPICGFPVISSFVTNPETSEIETVVRLARPNHYQSVYQGNVENVTVAQGGRRIGIDGWGESRNVDFQNYSWSVGSPMTFRGYRQFLERDTAFTDYSSGSALLNIRGPNADRGPFDICAGLPMPVLPEFGPYCQLGPIASTGEWVHVTTDRHNYDVTGCGPDRAFYGSYLVPVGSSGTRQVLREVSSDPCPPEELGVVFSGTGPDVLAWRGDGAVAWVAHPSWSGYRAWGFDDPLDPNPPPKVFVPTALQTSFEQVSAVAGVAALGPRSVSDRLTYALGWRSDGTALISYESLGLDWTECQRAVRAGLAPEIQVTDSAGSVPFCANAVMEPLAAPRLMSALGAALRPMATVPSGWFPESRIHTPRRRTVQPMVLVN